MQFKCTGPGEEPNEQATARSTVVRTNVGEISVVGVGRSHAYRTKEEKIPGC